jgi:hypothetical protein
MSPHAAPANRRAVQLVFGTAGLLVLLSFARSSADTGCTPDERSHELRAVQSSVLRAVPERVDSLPDAIRPGGPLAGWHLSHGLVVLDGSGGVGVDNIAAKDPTPQLLLYAPSPSSTPDDWLDFDDPDGPYRLIGWAYLHPYEPGSTPPKRRCVAANEWFVHEAGWHLNDGGMLLTPGATTEPPRPQVAAGIYFWHPRAWDIHFWRGEDGLPTIAFANPWARRGGVQLPQDAFFYLVDGRKEPPPR